MQKDAESTNIQKKDHEPQIMVDNVDLWDVTCPLDHFPLSFHVASYGPCNVLYINIVANSTTQAWPQASKAESVAST